MSNNQPLVIGVDYGVSQNDIPSFTVVKINNDVIEVIDSGQIKHFDYSNYVATEHQIVGYKEDLELFNKQFITQ